MADEAMDALVRRVGSERSRAAADRIAARARQLAPVATGELRESVHVESTEGGHDVVVGTNYWLYIEFGHREVAWGHDTGREVPAQPFMRPALHEGAGQ